MVWFDLITPKSVMFFKGMILELQDLGNEFIVTTRGGEDYEETVEILKLYHIPHYICGSYGGVKLTEKFNASLLRQSQLKEIIAGKSIQRLINLCSVDACRIAFGYKIPIINFCDIPIIGYDNDIQKASPQARLTLPLSTKIYHPFMIPNEIFTHFAVPCENIISYQFLDVVTWLQDFKPSHEMYMDFLNKYKINNGRPNILVREEEFKASYVDKKTSFLYEALREVATYNKFNIIIIPRYTSDEIKRELPFGIVINEKIIIQHILAFCDLFIGGGGTLNSESCYFGTPTISTRSFISHYDKFLIDEGLMINIQDKEQLIKAIFDNMKKKKAKQNPLLNMKSNMSEILKDIIR